MASPAPMELMASDLYKRLQNEQQVVKDFWVHIHSSSVLEKYPAKQHAHRVAQKLGVSEGLIYLPGAPTQYEEDSDQPKPFRQRRYFYYMSGVNEADCHLAYDINEDTLTLFIPKIDPQTVIWNGRGSTRAEAFDKYDVDEVSYTTSVPHYVNNWPISHEGEIYILHPDQAAVVGQDNGRRVDYRKLQVAVNSARMVKDSHEIGLIRKANEITAKAHREVLLNILKFKNESQVEAVFLDTCVAEGAKHQAYEPIAASGVNASTLHYIKNDEPLEGRQLMCLDAGCEWDCYASDVTRSFPLSGSWPSREAKQIHDLVQTMQDCCIERLAPGVRYLDIHILAHYIAIGGLMALGILHNGSAEEIYRAGTSRAFFPHGLGHHIGLEVHDIGQRELMSVTDDGVPNANEAQTKSNYSPNHHLPVYHSGVCLSPVDPLSPVLEEGMVVTVEPGIYFSLYALETLYLPSPVHSKYINKDVLYRYLPIGGVRIEDDILITATGYQNLTTAPKGEEMLKIIKSQAKGHEPSITTTTAESVLPDSPTSGSLIDPTQSTPQRVTAPRPAPRPSARFTSCHYCRRRKIRCSGPVPSDNWNRCGNCVRFNLADCYMSPVNPVKTAKPVADRDPEVTRDLEWHKGSTLFADFTTVKPMADRDPEVTRDLEWHKGSTLFADFTIPAIAAFTQRGTSAVKEPEISRHLREESPEAHDTDEPSSNRPHIARFLGSQKPASSGEESLPWYHSSHQPWDGMDALGFAVDRTLETVQKPPQVPQKPLAYRHSMPCLAENSDMEVSCPAEGSSHQTSNTVKPLDDSPLPPRSRTSASSQSLAALHELPRAMIGQERLSKVRDHLFRPQAVPETWGSMRNRMNQDPPAVPQWLCSQLEQLCQTYPSSNVTSVMMFSAIDAKSSVVLQLKPDLPAPAHPGVLYTYLPRIRCMDCPGKLYTPPLANFEIHLKNRFHKAAVLKNRSVGAEF